MRLLILLLVLGVGGLFFVQNQQAITLVFFGNLATVTLPMAVWVLLFIAAGAITSFVWQILTPRFKPPVPGSYESKRSRSFSPPPPPPQSERTFSNSRPPQEFLRSPAPTTSSSATSDWESKDFQEEWDDWEVKKPQPEPRKDFIREPEPNDSDRSEDFERTLEENKSRIFEAEQQPKSSTQTGSVYSYVYREPKDRQDRKPEEKQENQTEDRKTDRVYDANYRVIRPPYRENVEEQTRKEEDAEDWI
jgi:hypothetical protein